MEILDDENSDKERDNLIYHLIKKRYDDELQRINNLDTKATNLIGFISIVIGVLLGVGVIKFSGLISDVRIAVIFFIGIGLLLTSVGFSLGAFRVRRWSVVPDLVPLLREYAVLPYSKILHKVGGTMKDAVTDYEKINNDKAKLLIWSWYFLISGLTMLFVFIVVYYIKEGMTPS